MKPYYQIEKLIIDYRARDWCKLPYPDHPFGCPNYGVRNTCPPNAPLIKDYFDLSQPLWLIVIEFNLAEHISRMKQKHPNWSDRQAKCVLYWQSGVNKELHLRASQFTKHNGLAYTLCPEAMGVQVIRTARLVGIPIESRPIDYVYKVAISGTPPKQCYQEVMELV